MGFSRRRPGLSVISKVLTASDAEQRRVVIDERPLISGAVLLFVGNGGGHQVQNVDFYLDRNAVRWDGKRLDGVLAAGDEIQVVV